MDHLQSHRLLRAPQLKIQMPLNRLHTTYLAAIASSLLLIGCATQPQVTETEIRREYERLVAQLPPRNEYLVRHILVERRDQADAALERIKAGESFADVAASVSRDPGSSSQGGDLGWSLPEYFIEEFSQTMVSLAPRGIAAAPTQTRFGWHIIEVTGIRPAAPPPYPGVRDAIAKRLLQRKMVSK